jgi:glutaredoxin
MVSNYKLHHYIRQDLTTTKFKKMKKSVLSLSVLSLLALTACSSAPAQPGKHAELAKCLTEKGVVMYGASWCPHCQNQKKMFGGDWQFVTYQECDQNSPGGDQAKCRAEGVLSYPTWKIPGVEPLVGEQTFFTLAKESNCLAKLPAEDQPKLQQ